MTPQSSRSVSVATARSAGVGAVASGLLTVSLTAATVVLPMSPLAVVVFGLLAVSLSVAAARSAGVGVVASGLLFVSLSGVW